MRERFADILLCAVALLTACAAAFAVPNRQGIRQNVRTFAIEERSDSAPEPAVPEKSAAAISPEPDEPEEFVPVNRNLNTATESELMRVPGIGSVLAKEITDLRARSGGFRRRAELLAIRGIGEARLNALMAEFEIPGELPPEVQSTSPAEAPQKEPAQQTPALKGPFDLNSVTREELLAIPGMSEKKADAVLELREKIRYFSNFYELTLVDAFSGVYIEHVLSDWLYVADEPDESAHP